MQPVRRLVVAATTTVVKGAETRQRGQRAESMEEGVGAERRRGRCGVEAEGAGPAGRHRCRGVAAAGDLRVCE
jgi:hypothetical protein